MKDRFKELRKELKLTQEEFGAKMDLSRSYINLIEMGKKIPAERTIKDICRTFGISYEWLMYGTGKMFKDDDSDAQAIVDAIMTGDNEFAKKVIVSLAKMDEDKWEMLKEFIEAIAKE